MSPEQLTNILKEKFAGAVVDAKYETALPQVVLKPESWPQIAMFLRNEPKLQFNLLRSISTLDMLEDNQLVAIYHLCSCREPSKKDGHWTMGHEFTVAIKVPRDKPNIPTVAHVWPAADWHEREAYDLMGINFEGHPDSVLDPAGHHPRRILCADDWVGHPLRKYYKFPLEYHGIPAVTEYGQTRPVH